MCRFTCCVVACLGVASVTTGCDPSEASPQTDSQADDAPDPRLPALALCDAARMWDAEALELEAAVLARINERRAEGVDCGARGSFEPAPPLQTSGALRCAARLHSLDMLARDFVDHADPDDRTPWDRLRAVEARFATADETIAAADLPARDIVDALWMMREGSCAALSAGAYTEVGVGVVVPNADEPADPDQLFGNAPHWTVLVAKPLR